MTSGLDVRMIHSCTILRNMQDQRLGFSMGADGFTVSKILLGSVSEAEGTIKSVVLTSGVWSLGSAVGYLILSNVSGTFEPGEGLEELTIPGGQGGTAIVSGSATLECNEVGTPVYTQVSTSIGSCRFSNLKQGGGGGTLQDNKGGRFILQVPGVFFLPDTDVQKGDRITTTAPGFENFTYTVFHVETIPDLFDGEIDHIEASLETLEKKPGGL